MKPCRNNKDILANRNHESINFEIIFLGFDYMFISMELLVKALPHLRGSSLREYSRRKLNYDSVCVKVNLKSVFPIAEQRCTLIWNIQIKI